MPIIYSNVSNENYSVCCMGQTVYVYQSAGRELARFTLVMADFPVISPKGDIFAVKSKDGCLAVYSFEKLSRIATLKFSDKSAVQEKGMCFSADGEKLYSVENDGTDVAVYDMNALSAEKKIKTDKPVSHIECSDGELFVLGTEADMFVSKLGDDGLTGIKTVDTEHFDYYYNYKCAEARGFSSAAMDLYLPKLHNVEENKTSLKELWEKAGE